jgi:D-alanyl-D-alanine carboxypeptidase
VLASHVGTALSQRVAALLHLSDSFSAELLLKEIGASAQDPTTAGGLALVRRVCSRLGLQGRDRWTDGSGLGPANRETPFRQVQLLQLVDRSPVANVFRRCQAVGGRDGTLAGRLLGTSSPEPVRAKSGTRRCNGSVNLAGFAQTVSGRRLWFSFMLSGATSIPDAVATVDGTVVALVEAV